MKKYILTSVCEKNLEMSVEGVFDTQEDAYNLMKEQYENAFDCACGNDDTRKEFMEDCSSLEKDCAMLGWGLMEFPISWCIHEVEIS